MHRSHENDVINKEQEVRYNVLLCNNQQDKKWYI